MSNDLLRLSRPINWNKPEDPMDVEYWNRLITNFWIPEAVPISNDLRTWATLNPQEQQSVKRVLAGLTLLDTLQGVIGATSMLPDAHTQHEQAVLLNIAFMEAVHAKSYSSIFSTLCSTQEIDEVFRWAEEEPLMQKKVDIVSGYYKGDDPLKRKIASVMLEGFLFLSSFYLIFYFAARAKLTNTADIIRLILRDEQVHGSAIGYWFQKSFGGEPKERQDELREFAFNLLYELYDNECKYIAMLYDPLGVTEDARKFLHWNGNKALMNLGFDPMFPADTTNVSPEILSGLSLASETHDFFSGAGSSYSMGTVEELSDEEWADIY